MLVTAGGVQQVNVDLGAWQGDTDRAIVFSLSGLTLRYSVNGGPVQSVSLGAVPSGLTTVRYGLDSTGVGPSTILRRVAAYGSPLADGQMRSTSLKRPSRNLWGIGDSITAAGVTGQTPGYGYLSQLGRLLGRPIFNSGIGGQTSTQILARLQADIDHLNWVTIIDAGRNDGSAAGATIQSNIAAMVAALPSNARYLVMSIPFATTDDTPTQTAIASTNVALASTYGTQFLNIDWSTITRVSDGLHPDDGGNTTMAAAAQAKISALGW